MRKALCIGLLSSLLLGVLAFVGATGAQAAASCQNFQPQWSSSKGLAYSLSSGFEMCGSTTSHRLVFGADGNLVFYSGSKTIWSSHTSGSGSQLRLQTNGELTVYGCSGTNCTQGNHLLWSAAPVVSGSGWEFVLVVGELPQTGPGEFVKLDQIDTKHDYANHVRVIGPGTG